MEHAGACFRFLSSEHEPRLILMLSLFNLQVGPSYEMTLKDTISTAFIFLDGLELRHAKFTPEIGCDIAEMFIPLFYKAINDTSVANGNLDILTSSTRIFMYTLSSLHCLDSWRNP